MVKKKINVIREEMLQVATNVAQEKNIDQDSVFSAMEQALEKAARVKYGHDIDIRVSVDRNTGDIKLNSFLEVVDEINEEFQTRQILINDAKKIEPQITVGDYIKKELPPIELGRVAAQNAKGVIIQKVREAERSKITQKYESLVGEVISGQVKRINRDFLLLEIEEDLNAQIPRDQIIPGEIFKLNDRVRAVIKEIVTTPRGPQIILSRTDERLVVQLFTQEVPEISEGTIEIKAIARDPGYRSKIAVKTYDGRIDPVGACVGMRGSRVQAVSNEIGNERIDIFIHSDKNYCIDQ